MEGELVDWFYNVVKCWQMLTSYLDTDALTDSNYEALWYTASITLTIEDYAGNKIGN